MSRSALFLDRDGVVNVDQGYVWRCDDFQWVEGIFDTVRCARRLGLMTIVVTNQAGIARGYYSEADFQALTSWMLAEFEAAGAPVTAVYHCPFHADGLGAYRVADHPDRKPNPGMLIRAAKDYVIDLATSALLGDKESDIEAALAAGVEATALFAPSGAPERSRARSVVRSHWEAQAWLIAQSQYWRTSGRHS
jgi:D-glycero-D-manno-heptose 1,7-bisphosphate phosphatase